MINMGYLDRDWYEGIVQKLKWNVPIRPETDAADIAMFTSRSLLRSKGVQGHAPVAAKGDEGSVGDAGQSPVAEPQASSNGRSGNGAQLVQDTSESSVGSEKP